MAKAFKCDKCQEFREGSADMQVGFDKQSETIFRHHLGVKFSPEMPDALVYFKDLCNNCAKSFCTWFRKE
jgi:hypothetical protein